MPVRPSKNVVQKIVELPTELAAEVVTFAASRNLSFKAVVVLALRRHLDNPPPPPKPVDVPPLPPVTSPDAHQAEPKKPAKRKK